MAVAKAGQFVKNADMIQAVKIAAVVCGMAIASSASAQAITKCQDAEGKWHYGNYASEKCGEGPVTELRESGVTLDVREAPPTVEELQAKKAREEAERQALIEREEKLRVDRTLLEKYPTEQVILDLRDQRVAELEKQIEFNRDQLAKLKQDAANLPEPKTEYDQQEVHELNQLIDRFERAIERGRQALEKTRVDYGKLLERYRQIDRDALE